jgi:hypothetical protein
MTPKRQAMIRHGNRQQFLIRIDLGLAGYHTISHHFIIWVIFHAKACFTPPTQTKVGSAHIQTGKR